MNSGIAQLNSFWRDRSEVFAQTFYEDLAVRAAPVYPSLPPEQLLDDARHMVGAWRAALEGNDPAPLMETTRRIGQLRAADRVGGASVMRVLDILRHHIWRLMGQLYVAGDWDMDVVEQIERWLHEQRTAFLIGYSESLQEAEAHLAERERVLEDQGRLIEELSAPIVPIHEGVLVLPLVGAIDSRRAAQIMELALQKIVEYQADVLILDVTGVPIVDTGVANYLIQMARAVTLLGARVALVGIGAEIAQTIVQLGVELRDITTLANLQAGITYALAEQGYAIRPVSM